MAIKQNPDKEYADEVKRKLKANGGYCPCSLIKSPDTKCTEDTNERAHRLISPDKCEN